MLTFLESVGRRSEAEFYLRMFHQLPKESFAIIVPGGPVVRYALGSIVEQLRFLADLGLYATVVLGLFDPEQGGEAARAIDRERSDRFGQCETELRARVVAMLRVALADLDE